MAGFHGPLRCFVPLSRVSDLQRAISGTAFRRMDRKQIAGLFQLNDLVPLMTGSIKIAIQVSHDAIACRQTHLIKPNSVTTPCLIDHCDTCYVAIETPFSPISSHPFRSTPTSPPVCMVSDPPPDSRHSISARPSSQAILVCAGTASRCSCSPSASSISARASPLLALSVLIVLRHDVTSLVDRRVVIIS